MNICSHGWIPNPKTTRSVEKSVKFVSSAKIRDSDNCQNTHTPNTRAEFDNTSHNMLSYKKTTSNQNIRTTSWKLL